MTSIPIVGNDGDNNSNASANDSNASSNGITSDGVSNLETSPSTRQYIAVTQSSIIKRKGVLKPESTDVEVGPIKIKSIINWTLFEIFPKN